MFRNWKRTVDMRNMTVVRLNLVENFIALLALHFFHRTFVGDVSFSSSEFLEELNETLITKDIEPVNVAESLPFYRRNIRRSGNRIYFALDS